MQRAVLYLSIASALTLTVGLYGCNKATTPGTPSNTGHTQDNHMDGNHMDGDHAQNNSEQTAMEKMEKGLANLSETDRASAMKQHACPVSGEMLGTMGAPIKVTVKDKDVWLCCESCRKKLLDNPDEYLAKSED